MLWDLIVFSKIAYFLRENEELPWPVQDCPIVKCASSQCIRAGGRPPCFALLETGHCGLSEEGLYAPTEHSDRNPFKPCAALEQWT